MPAIGKSRAFVHAARHIPPVFEEITGTDSALFEAFYRMYEAAFPLDEEREPPEAFDAIARSNIDLGVQAEHGPYREMIVAIRAWEGGPLVGGHVFGIATSEAHRACGIAASVQGVYTFFHPDVRGMVPIRSVVEYSQRTASRVFSPAQFVARQAPPVLFEVNNPQRMSSEEIELDTRLSGTAPCRRYQFWRRSGFEALEFPYVQPRLREDAAPIDYLDLFCTYGEGRPFPAEVLHRHLTAFMAISVLKGRRPEEDADCAAMLKWLGMRETIAFKDRRGPGPRQRSGSRT